MKVNNMIKRTSIFILSGIIAMVLTGCGTTTLQTKAKLTRTVVIDHSVKDNKNIYLQVTNTAGSGGENMQLLQRIKQNLEIKGYTIVNKSSMAGYGLFVNVLFANNLKEANAIKAGTNVGATAGTIAFAGGSGGRDALLIGVGVALGGAIIGSAMEDEVFRAVVDIKIRDYKNNLVETNTTVSGGNATIHNTRRAGNLNQFAGSLGDKNGAGDMTSNINEVITTKTLKNYEEHKTRAFVEATKMNLVLSEALPILEEKISRQITNLF